MGSSVDEIKYSSKHSATAQQNFRSTGQKLVNLLDARIKHINATHSGLQASKISPAYKKVEDDWKNNAVALRDDIKRCLKILEDNDGTARHTINQVMKTLQQHRLI